MSADPPGSPALRASDADRDRVTEVLRAALADGRLDPAEFHERLDAALSARTIDALAPLTADLNTVPGSGSMLAPAPAEPAPERLTIKERYGIVRRDGRWALPRCLQLRIAWSDVVLDLTRAVPSGPEMVIERPGMSRSWKTAPGRAAGTCAAPARSSSCTGRGNLS